MADGADFASYVVARWGALVRTLVLLGLSPEEAETVALDGLSRCAPGWAAAAHDGDVDAWTWQEVLARRREPIPETAPAPCVVDPTLTDVEERRVALAGVVAGLAALPGPERLALAASLGGGLDPGLATELAGVPPRPELAPPAERVAWALAAVPLRPEPADAVLARAAARRGRRTRWLAAVTVLLVVAAVGTWVGTRSPDEDALPDEVAVSPADNVAPVAWWANGVLHLPDVELETPRVRAMVEVPDGVVYVDTEDRVVLADRAGRLTHLGDTEPDAPIAGWTERGWVGWVDVAGGERELVVHDTRTGRDVDRRPAEDGARVIALDQDRLFYDVDGQPWSWPVPGAEPGREPGRTLVDVASAVRLSAYADDLVQIDQPLFDVQVTLRGREAQLSPDGDYVMARVDGAVPDELRVFRAADGRQEGPHLSDLELAVAAAFDDNHTITYLITRRDFAPDDDAFIRLSETGQLQMRMCDLDLDTCADVATVPNSRGMPVFAQ